VQLIEYLICNIMFSSNTERSEIGKTLCMIQTDTAIIAIYTVRCACRSKYDSAKNGLESGLT